MEMVNKAARNVEMEKAREQGETYAAIAKRFGLSPSGVSQILAKMARRRRIIQQRLDAPLRHVTRPYREKPDR